MLAHGHENFQLEILEVCARSHVIKREQFNIDYFKHSEETLFKSRKLSGKALYNLIKAIVGAVLSPLAKTNQSLSTSHLVSLKKIETNDTKKHSSIRTAAG